MPKMLMGQIEHARNRLKEIKAAKLGGRPTKPNIKSVDELCTAIKSGEITVGPAQLKRAFDAFAAQVPTETIKKTSGGSYPNYESTYEVVQLIPDSVDRAIANEVFRRENVAEIARWQEETELYNTREEILRLKATDVEDAIVLGDQQAALIALQDFADFEV